MIGVNLKNLHIDYLNTRLNILEASLIKNAHNENLRLYYLNECSATEHEIKTRLFEENETIDN